MVNNAGVYRFLSLEETTEDEFHLSSLCRAAYETAVSLYPRDTIQYWDGARIIARSEPKVS